MVRFDYLGVLCAGLSVVARPAETADCPVSRERFCLDTDPACSARRDDASPVAHDRRTARSVGGALSQPHRDAFRRRCHDRRGMTYPSCVAWKERLRELDSRVFKSLRQPDELAEQYLRRVVAMRGINPKMVAEVVAALGEHFAALDDERRR